jgi:hypothetical protein
LLWPDFLFYFGNPFLIGFNRRKKPFNFERKKRPQFQRGRLFYGRAYLAFCRSRIFAALFCSPALRAYSRRSALTLSE